MGHRLRLLLLIGLCQPYYSAMSTLSMVVNAGVGLPRKDFKTGGLWYSFLPFPPISSPPISARERKTACG